MQHRNLRRVERRVIARSHPFRLARQFQPDVPPRTRRAIRSRRATSRCRRRSACCPSSRPTMSMLIMATVLSSGNSGSRTYSAEPSRPRSSPVKAMNTSRRGSFSDRSPNRRASSIKRGRARGVVVGAVVDFRRSGRERPFSAEADVIVMRADDDRFIGQRTFSRQHADDILDPHFHRLQAGLSDRLPAGQRRALRFAGDIDLRLRSAPATCRAPPAATGCTLPARPKTPAATCRCATPP